MSSVRRRVAAASFAVAASLSLSACGTSFSAQTNQVYQPAVGANHRGEVDVLGTMLVTNTDGSSTVAASVINNTDAEQKITGVTVTTFQDKPLAVKTSTDKDLPLPSTVLVPVGGSSDAGGWRVVSDVIAGTYVKITFAFSDSAEVTVEAPVVARTAEYDDVAGGDGIVPSEIGSEGDKPE